MKIHERVKVSNKNNSVTNSSGKSVAFGYTIKLRESGEPMVRADGVCAVESIGGILCGETGHITGPAIRTLYAYIKDGDLYRDKTNLAVSNEETTYVIPVFLDRYQKEVYIHTSNIEFI